MRKIEFFYKYYNNHHSMSYESANDKIIKQINKENLNKIINNTVQGNTLTDEQKNDIKNSLNIIQEGIRDWYTDFFQKNGRNPTYSEMRNEFG